MLTSILKMFMINELDIIVNRLVVILEIAVVMAGFFAVW